MFCSARWKAYLRNLQNVSEIEDDGDKVIYHIFHSQMLWFTRDDADDHRRVANEHLERCNTIVDALEERLANTPKPSEVLDWSSIW